MQHPLNCWAYYACQFFALLYVSIAMEVVIRPSTRQDLPELRQLLAASVRTFYGKFYDAQKVEALLKRQKSVLQKSHASLLVAENGNSIVGFAALSPWLITAIDAVYIHPDWLRHGIGGKLVAALEAIAIQKHKSKISVIADINTSGFYQAQGFEIVSDWLYDIGMKESLDCHQLEKQLPCNNVAKFSSFFGKILLLLLLSLSYYSIKQHIDLWIEQQITHTSAQE